MKSELKFSIFVITFTVIVYSYMFYASTEDKLSEPVPMIYDYVSTAQQLLC
jgi:hypothetical protein